MVSHRLEFSVMSDLETSTSVEQNEKNHVNSCDSVVEESDVKLEKKPSEAATMNTATSEDSEYETLEEDNGGSTRSSRSGSRRSSFSDDRNDLSDDIGIEDEREDGDGQEENSLAKDKKLDDDEDRRNPQYIPKKGTFYEHDDRTMMDENEGEGKENDLNRREKSEEGDKDLKASGMKKGKVWTEKADRWTHDLYVEDEQKPKSKQELIDTYGYDIRNEEAPPKARRRRRYGRGPNKYTRNWEDEDAYSRTAPGHGQRRVFHNNKEDFPDLNTSESNSGPRRPRREKGQGRSKSPQQAKSPPLPLPHPPTERGERERGPRREREKEERGERVKPLVIREPATTATTTTSFSHPPERHHPPPTPATNSFPPLPLAVGMQERERERVGVGEREEPRVGRGRGFRGSGKPRPTLEFSASRSRPALPAFNRDPVNSQVQDSLKHAADMLVQDFSQIYIGNNNNTNNIVEETIIPRSERRTHSHHHHSGGGGGGDGQNAEPSGRAKRYSTQRQRSLPETTPPPTYSPPHNIPYYTQPPPTTFVPAPVYNEVAPPAVTSPPMQMVAFLPPGPPPTAPAAPPYPPPPLLNYMPPPTFPPMALQPPQMSGQFEELTQGAELYQGQGGITYYSTQTQSVVPRPNPPRRVKLAIPIVPPPDKSSPGPHKRESSSGGKQQELQSAAS